jgi:hypothetical protein
MPHHLWRCHRRVTNHPEAKSLSLAPQEICSKIAHLIDAEVALSHSHSRFNLRSGRSFAYPSTQLSGPEITINLIAFQFAMFTLTAAYLAFSVAALHRRNQVSWESLSSRLHPASSISRSARVAVLASDWSTRWSAFRDAGVVMQMADYAERNGLAVDPSELASLRADAIRMRFGVLHAFIRSPRIR